MELGEQDDRIESAGNDTKRLGLPLRAAWKIFFNGSSDAIFVHLFTEDGLSGIFIDVNDTACRLLDYRYEELLRLSPLDILAPEKLPEIRRSMSSFLEDERVLYEAALVGKNGKTSLVEINSHFVYLGCHTSIISIVRDITERRRADDIKAAYEQTLKDNKAALDLRNRQMECLNAIAEIVSAPDNPSEIMHHIINLVRGAMQHPEKVCVSISLDKKMFSSTNCGDTFHGYRCNIVVNEETVGELNVNYIDNPRGNTDTPFLIEEINFIKVAAHRIAASIERHRMLEELEISRVEHEQSLQRLQDRSEAGAPISMQTYGQHALSKLFPERFDGLSTRLGGLLDQALEKRAYRVDYDTSEDLRTIADDLGFLQAGPRDVVELYAHTVKNKLQSANKAKAKAYLEEGRLMAFELMGYLVTVYRNLSAHVRTRRGSDGHGRNT